MGHWKGWRVSSPARLASKQAVSMKPKTNLVRKAREAVAEDEHRPGKAGRGVKFDDARRFRILMSSSCMESTKRERTSVRVLHSFER